VLIASPAAAIALLKKSSKNDDVNVVLLEQEASRQARIQGYSLGISPIGAQALHDIGLTDENLKHLNLLGTHHYYFGKSNDTKFIQGKKQQDATANKMESFYKVRRW
jgi:2-polyprenyl-6-methoxyphenol hydroxylase-like FAD-dependent oxidoreductase